MSEDRTACLVVGCGNTLRGDDGVGPMLCDWAGRRFGLDAGVRVIAYQQWAPDLAYDIARAEAVVFVDSSVATEPGAVELAEVHPAAATDPAAHHLTAAELLGVAGELYGYAPRAMQLTVGAASTQVGEELSAAVEAALPQARSALWHAIERMLEPAYCV